MASVVYNSAKAKLMQGDLDLDLPVNVALVTSTYTVDIDAHDFFDDITNEVSGGNYTAGGITLSNTTVIQDNTDDEAAFDGDDVTWSNSTITARAAILYQNTGTASTSPLIAYFDFGSDQSSSSGDFTIQWNAEGLVNLG